MSLLIMLVTPRSVRCIQFSEEIESLGLDGEARSTLEQIVRKMHPSESGASRFSSGSGSGSISSNNRQ